MYYYIMLPNVNLNSLLEFVLQFHIYKKFNVICAKVPLDQGKKTN